MGHMVVATKPTAEDTNSVCKCSAAFAFRELRWASTEVLMILWSRPRAGKMLVEAGCVVIIFEASPIQRRRASADAPASPAAPRLAHAAIK